MLEPETAVIVAARVARLENFWSGLGSVLESGSPDSRLNDVVQLSYTVPKLRSNTEISDAGVSSTDQPLKGLGLLLIIFYLFYQPVTKISSPSLTF